MMFAQKVVASTATSRGGGVSTVTPMIWSSFRSSRTSSHYRVGAVGSRNRRLARSFCCHRSTLSVLPFYGGSISKNSHNSNGSNQLSPFPLHFALKCWSDQIGTANRMNGVFPSRRRRHAYATTVGSNETTTEPTSSTAMASTPSVSMGDDDCRSTLIETAAEEGCSATLRYAQRCKADESSRSSSVTSIVTASEQLLHATNATNLLLDQILEIRNKEVTHNKTDNDLTVGNANCGRDSRKKCVHELHRAFLSLVQFLLERMDFVRDGSNDEKKIKTSGSQPSSDDGEELLLLMDLVVKLSYRAHQLQFWFHRPLYKRIAVAFANHQKKNQKLRLTDNIRAFSGDDGKGGNVVSRKQQRRSIGTTKRRSRKQRQHPNRQQQQQNTLTYVLRSRINWIWTIYRWSNEESKNDDKNVNAASKPSHHNQRQTPISQHDVEWFFRDVFIALARNGEWSDLSYLLQGVLLSSSVSTDEDLIICGNKTGRIGSLLDNQGETNQMLFLDERLVIEILISMQRQGIFPSIWKSENVNSIDDSAATSSTTAKRSPSKIDSEAETDILGIILLMEPSIWRIFENEYDTGASDSRNNHIFETNDDDGHEPDTSANDNTALLATDLRQNHQASLRDAIEALLETESSYRVFNNTFDDDNDFDDLDVVQNGDDEDTSKAKHLDLLDDLLIDLLQDLNSRDNNDTVGVIVSISKSPDEVMGEN